MATEEEQRVPYMFNRDFRSSIRLNYNHWLVKEVAGYLLHPSIPQEDPNLRIADVVTGTAIWSLKTAASLPPNVQIHGFDISPHQFPPATSLPNNLHLHTHDCFQSFAPNFLHSFDVVHAQFWLCLVNDPDAPTLLTNLISLLKPGGYLQWFEPLPLSARTVRPAADFASPAVDRLTAQWHKPKPSSTYDWVESLPRAFRKEGLAVMAADCIPLAPRYRFFWGHSQLAGLEDVAADVEMLRVECAEALKLWIGELNAEMARGACVDTSFICVVGRKP
ncbi:hypothetical protein MMC34_002422 [Xylographa carneopallida]|nr:hypothetical protein [Xylographa carneopallida]